MSCGEAQEGSREEIDLRWVDFVTDLGGLSKRAKKKKKEKIYARKTVFPTPPKNSHALCCPLMKTVLLAST